MCVLFDSIAPKYFTIVWFTNISDFRVPDKGYSRNVSYTLNLISTFLLQSRDAGNIENRTTQRERKKHSEASKAVYQDNINDKVFKCHCSRT